MRAARRLTRPLAHVHHARAFIDTKTAGARTHAASHVYPRHVSTRGDERARER